MKIIYHPMKFYKIKKINMIYPYEKSYIVNNVLEILSHGVCLNIYKDKDQIIFLEYFWNPDFLKMKNIKFSSFYKNRTQISVEGLKIIINRTEDRYILEKTYGKYIFIDKIGNYLLLSDNYERSNFIIPIDITLKLINNNNIDVNNYLLNKKWCKCHCISYNKLIDIKISEFTKYYGCENNIFFEYEDMEDYLNLLVSYTYKTYTYMTLSKTKFDKYIILYICNYL